MIEFEGFVYWHNGEHEAWVSSRAWRRGELMRAGDIVWPEVKPGDIVYCGTCGHHFMPSDARPPVLSPVRPRESKEQT